MELTDADGGHEAAAQGTLLAIAEEEVAAAGGAKVADEDVWSAETGADELGTIGFTEVEEDVFGRGLVAGGHHVQPLDGIGLVAGAEFVEPLGGFGELREELRGDFGANLVTATADRRADGGEEVGGHGFKLHLHLADGFDEDALERTAPTGMDGGDGAFFGVDEENGDAVGGLDGQEKAGAVGGRGIAAASVGRWCVEKVDDVGMDLFQGNEFEAGCAEGGLEAAAVLEDVFFGVPVGETQIEDFFGFHGADTAGFGAETVHEPGELCECGDLEDLNTLRAAHKPVGVGWDGGDR
jgi:hypothetical protein